MPKERESVAFWGVFGPKFFGEFTCPLDVFEIVRDPAVRCSPQRFGPNRNPFTHDAVCEWPLGGLRPPHTKQEEKKMKSSKLLLVLACLITIVGSAFAQNAPPKKTFGYIDGRTGIFHPLNRAPLSEDAAAAVTLITGTSVYDVTITVSSALPTTATITCELSGGVADAVTDEWSNVVAVTAKRTGNTAPCTLTMPYSWDLEDPTKDTVELDLAVTATNGTFGAATYYYEENTTPETATAVAKTGTTTTKSVSTTI